MCVKHSNRAYDRVIDYFILITVIEQRKQILVRTCTHTRLYKQENQKKYEIGISKSWVGNETFTERKITNILRFSRLVITNI